MKPCRIFYASFKFTNSKTRFVCHVWGNPHLVAVCTVVGGGGRDESHSHHHRQFSWQQSAYLPFSACCPNNTNKWQWNVNVHYVDYFPPFWLRREKRQSNADEIKILGPFVSHPMKYLQWENEEKSSWIMTSMWQVSKA